MKVKDLISKLQEFDQELNITIVTDREIWEECSVSENDNYRYTFSTQDNFRVYRDYLPSDDGLTLIPYIFLDAAPSEEDLAKIRKEDL